MKVLQLLKTSVGAVWALDQMRELVQLGVDVHVALPADGPLIPDYQAAGVTVHALQTEFPLRALWKWPRVSRQLRGLVQQVGPDIIHSHFVGTTLAARISLGECDRIPRVFQVPGPLHLENAFFRRAELRTAARCDHWIASCRWTRDCYRAMGVPAERVFLSYYGTDTEQFRLQSPGKLRRELGIDGRKRIVGMVAYMYAPKRYLGQRRGLKGHEDLIDALRICCRQDPDVLGVFIGGAWNGAHRYEQSIRRYGKRQLGDRIHFLGTRSDVSELYPDLDVVVHPSHSENLGGARESLLAAIPTIATAVGGFPDLIEPGETGWLVPAKDPPRLADAILHALGDRGRALRMALEGQARTRHLCDIRRTSREVQEIYRTILGAVPPGTREAPGEPASIRAASSAPAALGQRQRAPR